MVCASAVLLCCRSRPVPRMLNMSDNALSGPFPAFLITQPPLVEASCQGCMVRVGVNGSAMNLQVSPAFQWNLLCHSQLFL